MFFFKAPAHGPQMPGSPGLPSEASPASYPTPVSSKGPRFDPPEVWTLGTWRTLYLHTYHLHMYIPGTQMNLVLVGKDLVLGG